MPLKSRFTTPLASQMPRLEMIITSPCQIDHIKNVYGFTYLECFHCSCSWQASYGDRNYTAMRTRPCHSLFICQLYLLPDLCEEMDCKEDMPLTLPFASFVSLSQLIIVI